MNDYQLELKNIREFLKKQKLVEHPEPFPYNHCDRTARVVLELTGLPVVSGTIQVGPTTYNHTCNYDPTNRLFIDLTRDQFGFKFPEIVIEKEENSAFAPLRGENQDALVRRVNEMLQSSVKVLARAYMKK